MGGGQVVQCAARMRAAGDMVARALLPSSGAVEVGSHK